MKITCQSCQSKYTVSDEKVQGKTVKIKCRKCGATILVGGRGRHDASAGAVSDASSSPGTADGATYLVNVAEGDQRSMALAEVVDAYNHGIINGDTYVWADGMGDWLPLGQVDAIVAALERGRTGGRSPGSSCRAGARASRRRAAESPGGVRRSVRRRLRLAEERPKRWRRARRRSRRRPVPPWLPSRPVRARRTRCSSR